VNAAVQREPIDRETLVSGYAGRVWLTRQLAASKRPAPSELGEVVADILGEVFRGIYHLSESALFHERTAWHSEWTIAIITRQELANHDSPELTWLVLLCHAQGVRVAVNAKTVGYLEIRFSRDRKMFCGSVKSIDDVVAGFYERYPHAAHGAA
jgi:hypothetical protein